jgi:signal transduction histidine kinase
MKQRSLEIGPSASPSELVAAIAHEIGTPMTTILGYAELLAKSAGDEKSRERASTIVEQVHRVSRLTEKLLSESRAPSAPSGPVRLEGLLESALAEAGEVLTRRRVRLERRFDPVPAVLADPRRLQHVVVQLLLEAVGATPRAGVLWMSLAETAGEVEICVFQPAGDERAGSGETSGSGIRFRLALPAARQKTDPER